MSAVQATVRLSAREPHVGDLYALEQAEQVCFIDPWPGRFFASELVAHGRFQQVLVDSGGRLVAYLFTAWQYLDLHVLKVAALPEMRRQGLGSRLMAMAEEHAADLGGESVTLEVRPSNTAAIALYRSLGYQEVGRRPRYYANGEEALIMSKPISSAWP